MITNITHCTNLFFKSSGALLSTSYFYGLSTLAQVLAAIIGLFAIFILEKIRQTNELLIGEGEALLEEFSDEREKKEQKDIKDNGTNHITFREKIILGLDEINYSGAKEIFNRIKKAIKRKDTVDLRNHFHWIVEVWDHLYPNGRKTLKRDLDIYKYYQNKKTLIINFSIISLILGCITILFICMHIFYPNIFNLPIKRIYIFSLISSTFVFICLIILAIFSLKEGKSYTKETEESFRKNDSE